MDISTHLNELLRLNGDSIADLNSYTLLQSNIGESLVLIGLVAAVIVLVGTAAYWASRYKKCPSNKILVVYGKIRGSKSAKTLHGGGAFI